MNRIDWCSRENLILFNPKFSIEQSRELRSWVQAVSEQFTNHVFILTSGTTAHQGTQLKWVALSKDALLSSAHASNQHLSSNSEDIWLHTLPDFHVGGLGIWARSYLSGSKVVKLLAWTPEGFFKKVLESKATLVSLVPAQVYDLVQLRQYAPPSLRAVLVGGGSLSFSIYQRARELGWPLLPTYGMTEVGSQIATADLSLKDASLQVLSHLQVRIGAQDCIEISGSSLLTAYIFKREGKIQIFDPKVNSWLSSQDRGTLDGRTLQVWGRFTDFVKIGGESVDLGRLRDIFEELRLQLNLSSDSALIPVPDKRLGHVIHLISDENLSSDRGQGLIEKFNAKVLGFERIRKWNLLKTIPRTPLGKIKLEDCYGAITQLTPDHLKLDP